MFRPNWNVGVSLFLIWGFFVFLGMFLGVLGIETANGQVILVISSLALVALLILTYVLNAKSVIKGEQKWREEQREWEERRKTISWIVELHGRPIARFSDPKFEEQHSVSYRVEPLTEVATERIAVMTPWFYSEYFFCLEYRFEVDGRYTTRKALTISRPEGDRMIFRGIGVTPE